MDLDLLGKKCTGVYLTFILKFARGIFDSILKKDWDCQLHSKMYLKLPLISEKENTTNLAAFNSKYIVIIGRYYHAMLNVIK